MQPKTMRPWTIEGYDEPPTLMDLPAPQPGPRESAPVALDLVLTKHVHGKVALEIK